MNEIIQGILNRRSIRKYTNDPISQEALDQVLQCGLYAASGGNHQVARLTVLAKRDVLDEIIALVRGEFLKMTPREDLYQNTAILKAHNLPDRYDFTFHAPILILVTAHKGWPNGMADSATALQNMQLAASALGLGACWVNQLHWLTDNQVLRTYLNKLGVRDGEDVYGSMVLGHPAEPIPSPAPRKEGRVTIIK